MPIDFKMRKSKDQAIVCHFVTIENLSTWVCPFCNGPQGTLSHVFLSTLLKEFCWEAECDLSALKLSTIILLLCGLQPYYIHTRSLLFQDLRLENSITLDYIWKPHAALLATQLAAFFEVYSHLRRGCYQHRSFLQFNLFKVNLEFCFNYFDITLTCPLFTVEKLAKFQSTLLS